MKVSTALKLVAGVAAGFVAFKAYQNVRGLMASGAKVADAVIDTAKKVVTEDLNPASDKNLIYSGVNAVLKKATGDDRTLGVRIYDVFHKDENLTAPATPADVAAYDKAQDDFRRAEITAQNKALDDAKMDDARTRFRLSELIDAKISAGDTAAVGPYIGYPKP